MRRALSAVFAIALGLGMWACNGPHSEIFRFGWEYGNLAAALASGRGFCDAMASGSGPSAWMPPLLPCLYALVFCIFGVKSLASALVLSLLRCLSGGLCLYWVLGWFPKPRSQQLVFTLAVFGSALDWPHQLADLNDIWWTQLWLCLALRLALQRRGRPWMALPLVLASPAAALTMAVASLPELLLRRRRAWLLLAWAGLGMLAWGARNQLVLGHPYPIKSNFWFDYQLANQWDDDGVLTLSTVDTAHPVKPNGVQREFLRLGEASFLEQLRPQVAAGEWLRRCLRRGRNAFLDLSWEVDEAPAQGLDEAQLEQARRRGLLVVKEIGPVWLFLERAVEDEPAGRLAARQGRRNGWGDFLWAYWFTLLPALAALRLGRSHPRLVVCYLAFLSPYLLVQHYARYQVSSLFLQLLLEGLALEQEGQ
ncbi:hypothetical protein ABS71_15060 [bacterium SCN 62-11]|nr:MAG: hypothetical protein ABS71_15060 [bacterium SCN 62-11]